MPAGKQSNISKTSEFDDFEDFTYRVLCFSHRFLRFVNPANVSLCNNVISFEFKVL